MDTDESKNNNLGRFLILIFCTLLLWTTAPLQTYAQTKIINDTHFLDILAWLDQSARWLPFITTGSPPQNVTLYDPNKSFNGYNLLVSAHAPEAILMDMNGKIIHQWQYPSSSLPIDHRHCADYWIRARILENGDLLAMIPHGGLLKIDKESRPIWFKRIICHHDFDIDSNGDIYTLTIKNSKLKDKADVTIDSIAILSPTGGLKREISIYGLFKKYPDHSYINKIDELGQKRGFFYTNNGSKISLAPPGDAFHSNSIQILDGKWASKIPAFKKGNLLISIHHLGVIICVDPNQEKIVWLMDTLFWDQGQNFVKLLDNGNILLFDNHYNQHFSRVVEFDPAAKKIVWDYSNQNGPFFSIIAGLCYRLPNGNTLITESTNGHSFEVTPDKKIVWEFYNPHQVDKNSLPPGFNQIPRFPGEYNKLIAMIFQMQRIPIDSTLNWLKAGTSDSFLDIIANANQQAKWLPLKNSEQKDHSNVGTNNLDNLQSLSYLQGYNPPSKFKNVVLYNQLKSFYGYNLFVSAHAPEAILMDMNGKIIHQWHYPSSSLPVDHRYCADYWDRVRLLKNGDLLAMIPYGGMLKIDKESHLIWFRRIFCHHDLDIGSNGDIYTLTVKNSISAENAGMKIDSITILAPNGTTKKEISLYDLFKKYPDPSYINKINTLNQKGSFFYTKKGNKFYLYIPGDVFHSNSIQILDGKWSSKIPAFKKGNLLISIRHLGVIICVDPNQEKIVWLLDTVFWDQGQHFVKLLDNGNILVFDNYYTSTRSRVVEFDPATKELVWDYSDQNGPFFSSIIGQCYRLPNGNTLITESTNGHSFEVTPNKEIVWEFYNPNQLDKNNNLIPFNVRIRIPDKYKKLIAITYQMQRIPIDSNLDWLKK